MRKLKLALKVAIKGRTNDKQYHLGAVAVRGDGSITTAPNVRTQKPNVNSHAEARVLRKAGCGSTLFIARVLADNTPALAKPCERCQQLIKQYKVKKVIYTIDSNSYGVWYPNKEIL